MASRDLADRRILVTRPRAEADALLTRLQELGARPIAFPALVVELLRDPELPGLLQEAAASDCVVFVSPSAVRSYFSALSGTDGDGGPRLAEARRALNAPLRAVAVGPGTVRALKRHGVEAPLAPSAQFDSDAVAALPQLQDVAGRSVAIVCGTGGRRSLGDALSARGAKVTRIECYRRVRPQVDVGPLLAVWEQQGIDAALLTSSEAVRNLWVLLGQRGQALWRDTPTFVPHERIKAAGAALGLRQVIVTSPGDEEMVSALLDFFG